MELNTSILNSILTELSFIKWPLVPIGIFGFLLLLLFPSFFLRAKKNNHINNVNNRKSEIENLLYSGKAMEAKSCALKWLALQPRNPHALWLLAQAHYDLGELVETKKILLTLPLHQFSYSMVMEWLERLESEIKQSGPQEVK